MFGKKKIAAAVLALTSAAGMSTAATTSPASATVAVYEYCDGNQWCPNAWNGGPQVNEYSPGVDNDYFALGTNNAGYNNLLHSNGGGTFTGNCIGDYGNSPTNARAGLPAPCTSNSTPWGGNFIVNFCNGLAGESFYDPHWGGYLAPALPEGKGAPLYLNGPFWCWNTYRGN